MKVLTQIVIILIPLLLACGSDKNDCSSAPSGATISISPSSYTVTEPHAVWRTVYFTLTVADATGSPLNKTRLNIFHQYAFPDWHGFIQLYDGSTPVNAPFNACTDNYGTYSLRLDYDGASSFLGDLEVRSGSAFATATIQVN